MNTDEIFDVKEINIAKLEQNEDLNTTGEAKAEFDSPHYQLNTSQDEEPELKPMLEIKEELISQDDPSGLNYSRKKQKLDENGSSKEILHCMNPEEEKTRAAFLAVGWGGPVLPFERVQFMKLEFPEYKSFTKNYTLRLSNDLEKVKDLLLTAQTDDEIGEALIAFDDIVGDLDWISHAQDDLEIHGNCVELLKMLINIREKSKYERLYNALVKRYTVKKLNKYEEILHAAKSTVWKKITDPKPEKRDFREKLNLMNKIICGLNKKY
jgi:hypothetical protein